MKSAFIAAIVLCVSWTYAQTITTTDAAGDSIVEVVTQIPPGIPTTEILQTITAPTLTTTSTTNTLLTTTTSSTKQQGPVGQPAETTNLTPGGPTPYTYITTNAAGETTTVLATFTPTGPATVLPNPTTTGTIVDFSSYVASYGSITAAASGGRQAFSLSSGWHGLAVSMALGIGGGVWFVLL